jgi:hypothetical protein
MGDKTKVLVGVAQVIMGTGYTSKVVGYTVDGVELKLSSDFASIKINELPGTVLRKLVDQSAEVTMKFAEGTLANFEAAIPGVSLTDNVLTIGGGSLQEMVLRIIGQAPDNTPTDERLITLNAVNPVGEVGIPYKKGEVSIIPVTFAALVDDSGGFGSIVDLPPVALTSLTEDLTAGFSPTFAGGTLTYSLAATNAEAAVELTATLADGTITYYDADHPDGSVVASGVAHSINLEVGANTVIINVALDGYGSRDYRLTITRAAA